MGTAEVQRAGEEGSTRPDTGQCEGGPVEPRVTGLDAHRERQDHRPDDQRDGGDDPATAEGGIALGVVTLHGRHEGGTQERPELGDDVHD